MYTARKPTLSLDPVFYNTVTCSFTIEWFCSKQNPAICMDYCGLKSLVICPRPRTYYHWDAELETLFYWRQNKLTERGWGQTWNQELKWLCRGNELLLIVLKMTGRQRGEDKILLSQHRDPWKMRKRVSMDTELSYIKSRWKSWGVQFNVSKEVDTWHFRDLVSENIASPSKWNLFYKTVY